jgi:hypothetical protein
MGRKESKKGLVKHDGYDIQGWRGANKVWNTSYKAQKALILNKVCHIKYNHLHVSTLYSIAIQVSS